MPCSHLDAVLQLLSHHRVQVLLPSQPGAVDASKLGVLQRQGSVPYRLQNRPGTALPLFKPRSDQSGCRVSSCPAKTLL